MQLRNWVFTIYDDDKLQAFAEQEPEPLHEAGPGVREQSDLPGQIPGQERGMAGDVRGGGRIDGIRIRDRSPGPMEADPLQLEDRRIRSFVYQVERCPSTGRLHLQGYIEFTSPLRVGGVKRILGYDSAHLEGRRGTRAQAIEYARKEDTRVAGPWENGVSLDGPIRRPTTLTECTQRIKDGASLSEVVESYPELYVRYRRGIQDLVSIYQRSAIPEWRQVQVLVYYGASGTGKTRSAISSAAGDYYVLDQGERVWFDGYNYEKTLIIDDFYGWIKYGMLLRILDGHPYRAEIKGGHLYGAWTRVIITSNKHPDEWYAAGLTPALKRRIEQVTTYRGIVNGIQLENITEFLNR